MVNAAKSMTDAKIQPGNRPGLLAGRELKGINITPWKVWINQGSGFADEEAKYPHGGSEVGMSAPLIQTCVAAIDSIVY
jgi:hypothetical protein